METIETNPGITQISKLTKKDFKTPTTNMFKNLKVKKKKNLKVKTDMTSELVDDLSR